MRIKIVAAVALMLAAGARGAVAQPRRGPPVVKTPDSGSGVKPASDEKGGDAPKPPLKEIDFKPKSGSAAISFNLEDVDLAELVKAISNITGKRFIFDGKLRPIKATVHAPEKITADEAYGAFLSVLEMNGMTVIAHGRFFKVVDTQNVSQRATPVIGTATPVPAEDRYVTRLYRLAHVDPNDVVAVLTRLKSKDGDISVYPQGKLLIITDTGANIARMLRIIEEVDVGGAGMELWVEPVHYGSSTEIAAKLNEILDASSGGGAAAGKGAGGATTRAGGPRIIADERTNSLVITATRPDYERLLQLIERVDVPLTGEGEIHVLALQHAGCKELAATLNEILGGGAAPAGKGRAPAPAGGLEHVFDGQVKVTCDELSNKLVTTASNHDFAQLKSVIRELDSPRRQVFIEAVIMDVSIQHTSDFGLGYHGGAQDVDVAGQKSLVYGGYNAGQSMGVPSPDALEGLALGVRGPDLANTSVLTGTGVSIPALGVVLHAMAGSADTNVLATPHILASDNVKAEISIGQDIPLQKNVNSFTQAAAAATQGGAVNIPALMSGGAFSAPQRQKIGTKISVTPHVNDSDQVRLELTEEISDEGETAGSLGVVTINERRASTTLVVRDRQTVVIGGLVHDSVLNGESKIPVLGDIPLLGVLFKQTTKKTVKSNLLLVLTPYVIRDQDDLRAIFERKMQERQEFLDRYFVFNDREEWKPPDDFRRTNGLVEDIRQSLREVEDKRRVEQDAAPKGPLGHPPGEPIAMPSMAAPPDTATRPAANAPAAATPAEPAGAPPPAPRRTGPRTQMRVE